ncbi:MAG TPA: hypothetical protein VFG86_23370, partial [Chloroflexota bacterium]|nr:hypothetical protein [Chloroflexota bacterium]
MLALTPRLCYRFELPQVCFFRYMKARRYTFVIADRQTGAVRRLTLSLWPTLAAVAGLFALPVLMGLGARWSASETITDLRTTNAALQMENSSYREATGQLASQINALQAAVDQLGERATVDPSASRAMDKLPAVVKSRAMGGASRAALGPMLGGSTDTALGVLSDLLSVIGTRLDSVRDSVERRHALAAATPSVWPVAGWLTSYYGNRKDPFTHDADFHPG